VSEDTSLDAAQLVSQLNIERPSETAQSFAGIVIVAV